MKRAALLGGVVLLAACGSSAPKPFRASGNAACAQLNKDLGALKEPAGIDGYRTWADGFTSLAQDYVSKIEALSPPSRLAKTAAKYVALERQLVDIARKRAEIAHRKKDPFDPAITRETQQLQSHRPYERSLEQKLGLTVCASG